MRITPLDVRKQEFRSAMRGLDRDEVHAFLATVADEYEAVLTDNKQLREKVIELDEKVSEYRNMERTLRDTLITAERVMTEARQNARKESELILRDAELKAQQQTANIAAQVEALRNQVRELRGHRDSYIARLQSLSEAQIGLLESYRRDFENEDRSTQRLLGGADEARSSSPSTQNVDPPAATPHEEPSTWAESTDRIETPTTTPPPSAPPTYEAAAPRTEIGSTPSFDAEDQWRAYSVGAGTAAAMAPAMAPEAPTPAPPVETHVDALPTDPPETAPEAPRPTAEAPAYEEARAEVGAHAPAPEIDLESASNPELAFQFADEPGVTESSQVEAPTESVEDSFEHVARAYEETASQAESFDAPAAPSGEWTPVGGHPDDAVAPYGSVPGEEAASFDSEPEAEAAEEGSGSRWSLSRFTRGLGNF